MLNLYIEKSEEIIDFNNDNDLINNEKFRIEAEPQDRKFINNQKVNIAIIL